MRIILNWLKLNDFWLHLTSIKLLRSCPIPLVCQIIPNWQNRSIKECCIRNKQFNKSNILSPCIWWQVTWSQLGPLTLARHWSLVTTLWPQLQSQLVIFFNLTPTHPSLAQCYYDSYIPSYTLTCSLPELVSATKFRQLLCYNIMLSHNQASTVNFSFNSVL